MAQDESSESSAVQLSEKRRALLASIGGGATAMIAGCSGSGNGASDGADSSAGQETTTDEAGNSNDGDSGSVDEFPVDIALASGGSTLDPQAHTGGEDFNVTASLYEQLTHSTRDGEWIGRLASDWEFIDDTTALFYIREGVTFHNGAELTPEDVMFSFRRVGDDDVGITSPQKSGIATIDLDASEVIEEEHAVALTTHEPDPVLPGRFTSTSGVPIMNKEWTEERDAGEIHQEANGTGPYIVEGFEEDVSVTLALNEDYWGWSYLQDNNLPQGTTVEVRQVSETSTRVSRVLAGDTDFAAGVTPEDIDRLENNDGTRGIEAPTDRWEYVKMRTDLPPFDSVEFRKAMNYAVDVHALNDALYDGAMVPSGQPTPDHWPGYNPNIEPYPYDPDRAEELVEESGYAGEEIELLLGQGNYARDVETCTGIVNYINELENVSCSLETVDFSSKAEWHRGPVENKAPFYHGATGGAPEDPIAAKMQRMYHSEGTGTAWHNDEFDEVMEEASGAFDDERADLMQECNRIIHDGAPEIFLWFRAVWHGFSDRIEYEPYMNEDIHFYEIERGPDLDE